MTDTGTPCHFVSMRRAKAVSKSTPGMEQEIHAKGWHPHENELVVGLRAQRVEDVAGGAEARERADDLLHVLLATADEQVHVLGRAGLGVEADRVAAHEQVLNPRVGERRQELREVGGESHRHAQGPGEEGRGEGRIEAVGYGGLVPEARVLLVGIVAEASHPPGATPGASRRCSLVCRHAFSIAQRRGSAPGGERAQDRGSAACVRLTAAPSPTRASAGAERVESARRAAADTAALVPAPPRPSLETSRLS